MKSDVRGRLRNIGIHDKKTLTHYAIFEAIANARDAIEERFGEPSYQQQGAITVEIIRIEGAVNGILITDNGIGLNDENLSSFETLDSRKKAERGGHGIGRLTWIGTFSRIAISSTFMNAADQLIRREFLFTPDLVSSFSKFSEAAVAADIYEPGTQVSLMEPLQETGMFFRSNQLLVSIMSHFAPAILLSAMPKLSVVDSGKTVIVNEKVIEICRDISKSSTNIDESSAQFSFLHVRASRKMLGVHADCMALTASGRIVLASSIQKELALKNDNSRSSYALLVSSDELDMSVNQERTQFTIPPSRLEKICAASLTEAKIYLREHISHRRNLQRNAAAQIVEEHPQFAVSIRNLNLFLDNIPLDWSDDRIAREMFSSLHNYESQIATEIADYMSHTPDAQVTTKDMSPLLNQLGEAARQRLLEYTVKRYQMIKVASAMMGTRGKKGDGTAYESTLHNFILPMGQKGALADLKGHNLWLIDDLLAYYEQFYSNTRVPPGKSSERWDAAFFNPYGFWRPGSNDPVVIVEFKRPHSNDTARDPVFQILRYVDILRRNGQCDADRHVTNIIQDKTPIECIIIADLTKKFRESLNRSLAQHPTPDGMGYYGFSVAHNASIRVVSYEKIIRDAKIRSEKFFASAGLIG